MPECLCGYSATFHRFSAEFNFFRCNRNECRLLFVFPRFFPQNLYSREYYVGESSFGYGNYEQDKLSSIKFFQNILNTLRKSIFSKEMMSLQLLDIGAANGFFVEIASNHGFQAEGIEVSESAVDWATRLGRKVKLGNIENLEFIQSKYHVITMFDVLEHTLNPKKALKNVFDLLRDDGVVVVCVPNVGSLYAQMRGKRWHAIIPPEHLFYFSRKSLKYLLESTGFEVQSMSNINKKHSIRYVVSTILQSNQFGLILKTVARTFSKYANLKLLNLSVSPPIYDNLLIVARKSSYHINE